jgi:glycosyltransferase involved in cell wall biosynthesis
MSENRMKILMCSDDPDTILSYGILSDLLINRWYKQYDISYCSLQHQIGKPMARRDDKGKIKYVKYPGHVRGERNPTFLPEVFRITEPDIFWTNFDIQHYINMIPLVPKQPLWIGWVPWDNHDPGQIPRAQEALKNVDIRVAISKFGFDFLNDHKVRMDDWIYNIVDTDIFKPLKVDDPRILVFKKMNPWYKDGMKMLLFVGRPNWRKRITHMMKIVEELHDRGNDDFMFFFHSNMSDPAAMGNNIAELIDASGIERKVIRSKFHWDMGISKEELNVIYNLATLYFAPHGGEGFGMPIAEAMAAGTPFIASDYCTSREFAGDNNERGFLGPVQVPVDARGKPQLDRGVVRPYPKVKEFADIIEQVWDDNKRLKKMGENGVKWAVKNCSPSVIAYKWRKIIDQFDIDVAETRGYKK